MTDEEFLVALIDKDEAVLDIVMEMYSKLMWAVASKYLNHSNIGTSEDIEELISDVFVRLWENPKGFSPQKGTLKTYLCMLTRSMAINKVKSIARHQHDTVDIETMSQLSEEESSMDWQVFFEAVMKLDETTRAIIIRRYFYEMKPSQIQKETGYDAKLIDNKLYNGKKQLVQHFKQLGGQFQ